MKSELDKLMDSMAPINALIKILEGTAKTIEESQKEDAEAIEEKRIEDAEYEAECKENRTDYEQAKHDSGMCDGDFL